MNKPSPFNSPAIPASVEINPWMSPFQRARTGINADRASHKLNLYKAQFMVEKDMARLLVLNHETDAQLEAKKAEAQEATQ